MIRGWPLALTTLACSLALPARAQDTAVVADTAQVRPMLRPPLSPRQAFLGSLILPGYAQSVLGRHRSGAMMLAFEAAAVFMVRETVLGIREARRNSSDSVLVAYVDGTGAPVARYERTNFPTTLVRSRKEHREDWIAVLVANHLFAALDALVAANLWDLPAEISIGGSTRSAGLAVRLSW